MKSHLSCGLELQLPRRMLRVGGGREWAAGGRWQLRVIIACGPCAYPAGVAFLFIAFPCNLCHIVARWPSKLKMKAANGAAAMATATATANATATAAAATAVAAFVVDCNILMTV